MIVMRLRIFSRSALFFSGRRNHQTQVQLIIAKAEIAILVSISLVTLTLSFPRFFRQPATWCISNPRGMSKKPQSSEEPHRPTLFRNDNDCKVGVDDDDTVSGGRCDKVHDEDASRTKGSQIYTIPDCQLEDSFDNYSLVIDNLGCAAFETVVHHCEEQRKDICSHGKAGFQRLVRLEAGPCDQISSLQTAKDVWNEIQKAKSYQSQFGHIADLYPRFWEETSDYQASTSIRVNTTYHFTAMQFNTLAEGLSAGPHVQTPFDTTSLESSTSKKNGIDKPVFYGGFDKVPYPEIIFDFSLRRWRLLEVILSLKKHADGRSDDDGPDILAMEEVDRFYGFFQPALAKMGYEGTFAPKPNAPGISLGWYSDGCALFWKKDIFEKISFCKRSYGAGKQVYLIAILRHRPTGRDVVVAVTHLKAQDSEISEKIRSLQAVELVKEVSHVAQALLLRPENRDYKTNQVASSSTAKVPIILLGDFNAEPYGECRECIPSIVGEADERNINNNAAETDNTSRDECCFFQSAYAYGTESFTTWKTRGSKTVKRVIDYIFHNCQPLGVKSCNIPSKGNPTDCNGPPGMRCTHTLSIPQAKDLESTFLPGFRQPSDHFMIAAKFEIDDLSR